MTLPSIIALLCPTCGADLTGLDTDAVFGCQDCSVAWEVGLGGLVGPYPLCQSEHQERQTTIAFPFWRLRIEPLLLPEKAEAPEYAYVTGFDLRRRSYFGDPGLTWTQERRTITTASPRSALFGMTLSLGEAQKLARYYIMSAIDRQEDISGFDLDILTSEPAVLLVAFVDEGPSLLDPITGDHCPSPAFCDLPALRRARTIAL